MSYSVAPAGRTDMQTFTAMSIASTTAVITALYAPPRIAPEGFILGVFISCTSFSPATER